MVLYENLEARTHLSIIIPCLNEADIIQASLNNLVQLLSKEKNARKHIEIIIADGGSQDNTKYAVNVFREASPEFSITILETEKGRACQMNAAAREAQGVYLLFLHADTNISVEAMQSFWSIVETEEADWGFFSIKLDAGQLAYQIISAFINWRSGFSQIATGDQGIFVKNEIFKSLKGFPEIPLMEDIALSKMLKKKAKAVRPSGVLSTSSRRWKKNGLVKTVVQMWYLRLLFFLGVSPSRLHRIYYPNA